MKHVYIASGIAAAVILIGGFASAQSAAFTSQMGVGAQGSGVTSLQTWLENNGFYNGPVTGYYGSLTMAAVEGYQSAHGISPTGYVGPLTLAALNAQASGTVTTNTGGNTNVLASLQAQLSALLTQIQVLESAGTQVTTGTTVPSGTSMSLQTNENASINGSLTAAGTSPFTYRISGNPSNGVITSFNSSTGAFTYMPNSNFLGSDTFMYTVSNSAGASAPMTVTIVVNSTTSTNTSAAPTGQALSVQTTSGVTVSNTLSASGSGPFTFHIISNPIYGTLNSFNSTTGAFSYTPNNGYKGIDSFTYTVSNSTATSAAYTVTITNS